MVNNFSALNCKATKKDKIPQMTRYQKSRFSYTLFVKMFTLFYWSVKEPSSGSKMNSINQTIFYTLKKEISSNILTEHCKLRFLHKRFIYSALSHQKQWHVV